MMSTSMASVIGIDRRLLPCGFPGCTTRRSKRVVPCAVGDGARAEAPTAPPSGSVRQSSEVSSSGRSWLPGSESAASGSSGSNVVQVLKANRGIKLIRNEGRRLGERRLAAFASAVALTTLAWYGQDLISELGRLTSLPVEELDGIIYFVICFNAVSLVLPKSRYSK